MSDSQVKVEQDASPAPDDRMETSSTIDSSQSCSESESTRNKDGRPSEQLPEWKTCGDESPLKQVQIKEFAVKNALLFLQHLLFTLKTHVPSTPSCQPRINKVDTIKLRKKEFKVLVGFLGATGAGKTTLINALIGEPHILPTSDERACTAVPVEVSYNKNDEEEPRYRAEVVYMTAEEWRQELEELFEDVQTTTSTEHGDGDGDGEDKDSEIEHRINETFDKVKCVYPQIRSREKLMSTSVAELIGDKCLGNILGTTKAVTSAKRDQFTAAIREYIDSGESSSKVCRPWPLVKLVRIFVKAPWLEPGITLVDLPGNMDSNSARSKVASNYKRQLSVTCIVAAATRAISEKNAQDLLEKTTKRNLQLDGLFNSESLCFIVSQTDRDFNIAQYQIDHPNLEEQCREHNMDGIKHQASVAKLKQQERSTGARLLTNKKLMKEISAQTKEIRHQLDTLSYPSGSSEQKRHYAIDDDNEGVAPQATIEQISLRNELTQLTRKLSETQTVQLSETKKQLSLSRRIKSLSQAIFWARSGVQGACIRNRNDLSTAAIRKDYENTLQEMGQKATKPLQVFCVAANVYFRYLTSKTQNRSGFPSIEDTQISTLRDWLISTTLATRDAYAQAFLEDVDNLVMSMRPWVNDKYGDMKMSASLREVRELQAKDAARELDKQFADLSLKVTNSMTDLIKKILYPKLDIAVKLAAAKAESTAERWGTSMQWSTHRTINRHMGQWKDSKGRQHKWNDDLVLDLTKPLLLDWTDIFFHQLPHQHKSYLEDGKKLIANFALSVADQDSYTGVADGLDVLRDQLLRTDTLFQSQTDGVFEEISKFIRETHRRASPTIRGYLEPMYQKCGAEQGKGLFKRNKDAHKSQMRTNGMAMHGKASEALQLAINELFGTMPSKLGIGYGAVLTQMKDEIKLFFDRNTSSGTRNSTRRAVSNCKVELQKSLRADFENLTQAWNSKALAVSQTKIDPPDNCDMDFGDPNFFDVDPVEEEEEDDDDYVVGDD